MEEQLRKELIMTAARYMADRKVENTTLDNQRRALSAFFNDIIVL